MGEEPTADFLSINDNMTLIAQWQPLFTDNDRENALYFEAIEDLDITFNIKNDASSGEPTYALEYYIDGSDPVVWTPYVSGSKLTVDEGNSIFFRGECLTGANMFAMNFDSYTVTKHNDDDEGKFNLGGKLISLLSKEYDNDMDLDDYAFAFTFQNKHVVDASKMIMPSYGGDSSQVFAGMFNPCPELTKGPPFTIEELPTNTAI